MNLKKYKIYYLLDFNNLNLIYNIINFLIIKENILIIKFLYFLMI